MTFYSLAIHPLFLELDWNELGLDPLSSLALMQAFPGWVQFHLGAVQGPVLLCEVGKLLQVNSRMKMVF